MVRSPYYQEQLTEGLLYQKYHPDIHSLTFTDMSKETVDATFDLMVKLHREYAQTRQHLQYLCVLEDVQSTPYLIKRVGDTLTGIDVTLVHSTVIVADSFLAKVIEAIIVPVVNKFVNSTLKFATTETEAFEWLDKRRQDLSE